MSLLYILIALLTLFIVLIAFVYLAPKRTVDFALNSTRKQSCLVRKELVFSDGIHFAYLEGGEGEPLMLLHGFGGNKDTFTSVSKFLVKHYRVIIPDIIGFGESAHPHDVDYSPSAQVERLRLLSQSLNLKNLHLGGNSMGGQIAMLYSAMYPSEISSLWLISPAGLWSAPKTKIFKEIIETGHNSLIASNVKEFKKVMAIGMNKPPFIPYPMLKELAQERIDNVELEKIIFQKMLDQSIEHEINGMEIPTLIVFGKLDRLISLETANVLNEHLTNSQVSYVENAGHVAMFEKPQQCADEYISFRDSI